MKRFLLVSLFAVALAACNNSSETGSEGKSDTSNATPSEADIAKDLQQMADSPNASADTLLKTADTLRKLVPMFKR